METSPTKPITLKKIRTEMKRVAKSQHRVFVQLSLLFLLPLSIGTVLFQTLKPIVIPKETNPNDETSFSKIDIILALGAYLVSLIFSLSAIVSITFTAFHGFIDEPIKLKAAIKSISASFFPLLATLLLFQAIIFILTFLFILIAILFLGALTQLGFASITASKCFIVVFAVLYIVTVIYFQVNWFLANSVVVVESRWGFEALKRSKALINGNKWFALYIIFVYGILYLMIFWNISTVTGSTVMISSIDGSTSVDTSSLIITALVILTNVFLLTMTQLYSVAAPTVLYALCKESQSNEYFSLPVNDQKVAFLV